MALIKIPESLPLTSELLAACTTYCCEYDTCEHDCPEDGVCKAECPLDCIRDCSKDCYCDSYCGTDCSKDCSCDSYTPPPANPVVITSASVSPTELVLGSEIKISWRYSGTKDSSGSWYLYRTDSSSFSSPTSIGNPAQSASSFTMTFGREGTYYIWVRYYGSSQGWSDEKCAGKIVVSGTSQKFTLTVTVKKNGSVYDSGIVSNIVGGTYKTMTQWASAANVDFPPSPAVFENYTWGKGTYTDKTMDLTVSSNTTMIINYVEEVIGSKVIIYTDGSWKTATPIIFTNGSWKEVDTSIYSEIW